MVNVKAFGLAPCTFPFPHVRKDDVPGMKNTNHSSCWNKWKLVPSPCLADVLTHPWWACSFLQLTECHPDRILSKHYIVALVFAMPSRKKSGEPLSCWKTIFFCPSLISVFPAKQWALLSQLWSSGKDTDWVIAHSIKVLCWPMYQGDMCFSAERWMGSFENEG